MDTGTLLNLLTDVAIDMKNSNVNELVNKFVQESSQNASRDKMATDVSAAADLLNGVAKLEKGRVGQYGAVRRKQLDEISISELAGHPLANRIKNVVNMDTTAASANSAMSAVFTQLKRLHNEIEQTIRDLSNLGFQNDVAKSACAIRIGMATPDEGLSIDEINSLMHKWDIHLQMLMEVATGTKQSKTVRRIEPGSITLTIEIDGLPEIVLVSIILIKFFGSKIAKDTLIKMKSLAEGQPILQAIPGFIEAQNKDIDLKSRNEAKREIKAFISESDELRAHELITSVDMAVDFIYDRSLAGDRVETAVDNHLLPENAESVLKSQLSISREKASGLINEANAKAIESEIIADSTVGLLPSGDNEE